LRFNIVIKNGLDTIVEVAGRVDVPKDAISVSELEEVVEVEQFLEKLTGYRFHIKEEVN
jgi:hypothetical protein